MSTLTEVAARPSLRRLVALASVLLLPLPARAADSWTTPYPGVRHLNRTGASLLNVHAAVVDLCEPGVSVRVTDFDERGKKTSVQGKALGAQLATNGDFYCRSVDVVAGSSPYPPCVGKPVYRSWGQSAHAGNAWPEDIHNDALFTVGRGRAAVYNYAERRPLEPWMEEALSGHPGLVKDGQVIATATTRNPRTALGISRDGNTLILLVVDGRNGYRGASDVELATLLVELGADRGFSMDGGGSSTFWLADGGVQNHPSDGAERTVGNHVAVYALGHGASPHCDRAWMEDVGAPVPAVVPLGGPGGLHLAEERLLFDSHLDAGVSLYVLADAGFPVEASSTWVTLSAHGATDAGVLLAGGMLVSSFERGGDGANVLPLPLGEATTRGLSMSSAAEMSVRSGPYVAPGGAGLVLEPPRRLSPQGSDGQLQAHAPVQLAPEGEDSVLALSVEASGAGSVFIYRCGQPPETGTEIHGDAARRFVLVPTGPGGLCAEATAPLSLRVDLQGHFVKGAGLWYQAVQPTRVVNTWADGGRWAGRLPEDVPLALPLAEGAQAAALVASASSPTDGGFVRFSRCDLDEGLPQLEFREGETQTLTVLAPLGDGGLCVTARGRPHVTLELLGLFVPPPGPDAGNDEVGDAGVYLPDAGGTGGGDGSAAVGGCGCTVSSALSPLVLLLAVALRVRRAHPVLTGRAPRARP